MPKDIYFSIQSCKSYCDILTAENISNVMLVSVLLQLHFLPRPMVITPLDHTIFDRLSQAKNKINLEK